MQHYPINLENYVASCELSPESFMGSLDDVDDEDLIYIDVYHNPHWRVAMELEINTIKTNQTWILVDPTCNKHPILMKWVFRRKLGFKGEGVCFKAHLVPHGFK